MVWCRPVPGPEAGHSSPRRFGTRFSQRQHHQAGDDLDIPEAGDLLLSRVVSRTRDLGLLDWRGLAWPFFHTVGAMPQRATRWIVMA